MAKIKITEKDIIICGHGSGRPSTKNLFTYTSQRYASVAKNGVHKGIAAVRRFKDHTDKTRAKFHDTYKTILGRNYYSQSLRNYVYTKRKSTGKYYSDCSSSGIATLVKIGFKFPWLFNTAAIYTEDKYFEDVPVVIKDGHIQNPEVLEVGDAILYIGNDPSRPKQIGHVEWVYAVPAKEVPKNKTKKAYSGEFPEIPKRGYFTLKDTGSEVVKLQKLVRWITGDKISADGILGKVTLASVKRAQKILGVSEKPAGKFGSKSLAAAKLYKK